MTDDNTSSIDNRQTLASSLGDNFKTNKKQVLFFTAQWCGPCRRMYDLFEKAMQQFGSKIDFYKLDVDDPANAAMCKKYEITAMPTFIFIDADGRERKLRGANGQAFVDMVERLAAQ